MDAVKLWSKIKKKFGSQYKFAEEIGWHRNKVSRMIRGNYIPNINEVMEISGKLHIEGKEFFEIWGNKTNKSL